MKKSMKAALLSAFVFPGAGHFFLKKYTTGLLLVAAAFASLYLLISEMLEWVLQITNKIQQGEVQLNVAAITDLVSKQTGTQAQLINIASTVLIVLWVIAILDSYRIGRIKDKNDVTGK